MSRAPGHEGVLRTTNKITETLDQKGEKDPCPDLWSGAWRLAPMTVTHRNYYGSWGFPGGSDSKESACNAGDPASTLGSGRSPGEGQWLSTPVFLPVKSHGQRSLAGYSPWDCKESDTTE